MNGTRASLRILVLVMVATLTACTESTGGSTESTVLAPEPTTTTTVPGAEATAAFTRCLRNEGVEIDDIPLDGNGRPMLDAVNSQLDFSDAATVEALSECSPLLSNGALDLGFDDEFRAAVVDQLAAFSRCVRARGVDEFPDPVPGFIGIGSPYPAAEIPYDDPDLSTAVAACQETVFGDM